MPAKGDPGAYISARLKRGDVVIDVGANEGVYAKQFAEKGADVLAIEPDPRCREALTAVRGLTVFRCVIGAVDGVAPFYRGQQTQQSSMWAQTMTDPLPMLTLPMLPLDAISDRAAAVKIDVQGGEASVLRGATRLLRACPLWVIELWPWGLRQAGETPDSVVTPFVDAGLVPRYMSDDDPIPTPDMLIAYLTLVNAPNEHINVAWVRP